MTIEHLKQHQQDLSKRPDHKALAAKGGRSKSPRKQIASRINGILANKKLNPEQQYMLTLLKNHEYITLLNELISMSLLEINNPQRRDKMIDQLLKLIPTRNINVNADIAGVNIWEPFETAMQEIKQEK